MRKCQLPVDNANPSFYFFEEVQKFLHLHDFKQNFLAFYNIDSHKSAALTFSNSYDVKVLELLEILSEKWEQVYGPLDNDRVTVKYILHRDASSAILNTLKENKYKVSGRVYGQSSTLEIYYEAESSRLKVSGLESEEVHEEQTAIVRPKIKVLIVDDSPTIRKILKKMINSMRDFHVIGEAGLPSEAEEKIMQLKPDVMTLDINMPQMTGDQFLRKLKPNQMIPTILITSLNINEGSKVLKALEFGAIDYVQKPSLDQIADVSKILEEKMLIAYDHAQQVLKEPPKRVERSTTRKDSLSDTIIGVGASTGGTEAIKHLLLSLHENIPPIVIVQHIPAHFSKTLAERLNELCPFEVKEAEDGEWLEPGKVLIAPGGQQMAVVANRKKASVKVFSGESVKGHQPSVDVLFHSLASLKNYNNIGVILTGMGSDGAKGLLEMREKGAFTIAQDENSCVVYGMPKVAKFMGAVMVEKPINEIAEVIYNYIDNRKSA